VVSRFVRKVRTSSGAVAVQVVTRRGRQTEQVEHLGSAYTDAELALLLSAARERLSPGQDALDLGDLASVAPRIGDVADWTASRRAGQAMLQDAVPATRAPRLGERRRPRGRDVVAAAVAGADGRVCLAWAGSAGR
jgi:hypothetical protein